MIRTIKRDDIPYLRTQYLDQHSQFWLLMVNDYKDHCFVTINNDGQYIGFLLSTDKWILKFNSEHNFISLAMLSCCLYSHLNNPICIKVKLNDFLLKNFMEAIGFVKIENEVYKFCS